MAKFLLAVLIAYAGWWLWRGPGRRGRDAVMTRPRDARPAESSTIVEARAVLGIGHDADEAEIRAAHRRLVTAVHPDRGGSVELTRRINAARDALLRDRHVVP